MTQTELAELSAAVAVAQHAPTRAVQKSCKAISSTAPTVQFMNWVLFIVGLLVMGASLVVGVWMYQNAAGYDGDNPFLSVYLIQERRTGIAIGVLGAFVGLSLIAIGEVARLIAATALIVRDTAPRIYAISAIVAEKDFSSVGKYPSAVRRAGAEFDAAENLFTENASQQCQDADGSLPVPQPERPPGPTQTQRQAV